MTNDPLIELIAKQSMSRLDEMERDLVQAAERTKFELDLVRRAKALKGSTRRTPADASVHMGATAGMTAAATVQRRNGNGRGNKREPIKRVMQSAPHREWRPGEISRALAEDGIRLSRDGARVTMNRMVEVNELRKMGDGGGYMLVTSDASASDTASPAAPASANGENREMGLTIGVRGGPGLLIGDS